jgi:hypothetical protein
VEVERPLGAQDAYHLAQRPPRIGHMLQSGKTVHDVEAPLRERKPLGLRAEEASRGHAGPGDGHRFHIGVRAPCDRPRLLRCPVESAGPASDVQKTQTAHRPTQSALQAVESLALLVLIGHAKRDVIAPAGDGELVPVVARVVRFQARARIRAPRRDPISEGA